MLPFEFTIKGPAVSAQTKNRQRLQAWKASVRAAATAKAGAAQPILDNVIFSVTYYYDTNSPDVDNIIKPLQDALNGVVYVDDDQIQKTTSRKKDINGSYRIRGASPIVLQGFMDGDDFLHITVEEDDNGNQL